MQPGTCWTYLAFAYVQETLWRINAGNILVSLSLHLIFGSGRFMIFVWNTSCPIQSSSSIVSHQRKLSKICSFRRSPTIGNISSGDEAVLLPSLANFRPEFMSLTKPHPIWTTVDSNRRQSSKQDFFLADIGQNFYQDIAHKTRMAFAFPLHAMRLWKQLNISWSIAKNILTAKRGCFLFGFPRQMMWSED